MIPEADPVWLMDNDDGPTGQLLKALPADWRDGLRTQLPAAQSTENPWEQLVGGANGTPQARVFEAGASQWRALGRLARIRTGAATMRSDWPIKKDSNPARRRVTLHWLGWDDGWRHWRKMKSTPEARPFLQDFEASEKLHRAEAAKRGTSGARQLPDWEERIDRIARDLVFRWMASGLREVPGFCWWSDSATTEFFAHTANRPNLMNSWVRATTARLGLRKAGFVWVSGVKLGHDTITLLSTDHKPLWMLYKR